MKNGYELFVRPLLFSLDAETAHHLTIAVLQRASHFDPALRVLKSFQPSSKPKTLFGLTNPKPRIFRLPEQQALINRLGFNNDGADAIAQRLAALRESGRWPAIPVGINIGKSRATPLEQATG